MVLTFNATFLLVYTFLSLRRLGQLGEEEVAFGDNGGDNNCKNDQGSAELTARFVMNVVCLVRIAMSVGKTKDTVMNKICFESANKGFCDSVSPLVFVRSVRINGNTLRVIRPRHHHLHHLTILLNCGEVEESTTLLVDFNALNHDTTSVVALFNGEHGCTDALQ